MYHLVTTVDGKTTTQTFPTAQLADDAELSWKNTLRQDGYEVLQVGGRFGRTITTMTCGAPKIRPNIDRHSAKKGIDNAMAPCYTTDVATSKGVLQMPLTVAEAREIIADKLTDVEKEFDTAKARFVADADVNPLMAVTSHAERVMHLTHLYQLLHHHAEYFRNENIDWADAMERLEAEVRRMRNDMEMRPWRHNNTSAVNNVANLCKADALADAIRILDEALFIARRAR